ncbi:hypothetical protein ACT8ZV_08455 [Nocardioides sp. MAHUQ-72]
MYESNLSFAQAEIAYRTEQISSARAGRQRRGRLTRGRRAPVAGHQPR